MTSFHFRRRKGAIAAVGLFAVLLCLFVGYLFWCGKDYARVQFSQEYWLLVRECEDTTASAIVGESYVLGGAGNLIEVNGARVVALACYYTEREAKTVQRSMDGKGVATQIIPLSPEDLELRGDSVSAEKRILANTATADECARILYDTANGLERAECSQEEARAALKGVLSSLKGLQEGNGEEVFSLWNAALESVQRRGEETVHGILFARDLRYLQVQLCITVTNVKNYF